MPRDNDVEVVIWTGRRCGACTNAKQFLGRKGIQFSERRLKSDPATQRSFARATGGARTVPQIFVGERHIGCLLYTSPSPRDKRQSRMPSSA